MAQRDPTPAEQLLTAIAKILDEPQESSFSLTALQLGLRVSVQEWSARYSGPFDAMLRGEAGGAAVVGSAPESEGASEGGRYVLTSHGQRLVEDLVRQRMDELLQYLPRLEEPGRRYVEEESGEAVAADGVITLRPPTYGEDVREFFRCAAQPFWTDFNYSPSSARRSLRDDVIRSATLPQVRTLLTFCVRGERFSDGFWQALLEEGRVQALLHRLQDLREG